MADVTDLNTYPIPSSDLNVLERNAQDFDRALNAGAVSFTNRAGKTLPTFEKALQNYASFSNQGLWTTSTLYNVNDLWQSNIDGTWYVVLETYTSGASEAADIAAGSVAIFQTSGKYVFESVADMVAAPYLREGDKVRTLGYDAIGDGGANDYEIVAAATGTDDGGSYIDLTGISGQAQGLFLDKSISVAQFGALPSTSEVDHTAAIQAAIDYAGAAVEGGQGRVVDFHTGVYYISSRITLPNRVGLRGANGRGTVIRCFSTFVDSYMFHAVNGTSSMFGSWMWDFYIDARGFNMSAVIYSQAWQETCGMKRVVIQFDGTTPTGFLYSDGFGGAAYLPLEDIEVFADSTAAAVRAIRVNQISLVGGFVLSVDGMTAAGSVTNQLGTAIAMDNDSLFVKGLHIEYANSAVTMSGAGSLSVDTATGSVNSVVDIIALGSGFTGKANIRNIIPNGATGNTLTNNVTGKNIPASEGMLPEYLYNLSGFSAYRSTQQANVTGNGTDATVIFDTEIFDNRGEYDNTTGIFTALRTGKYLLTAAVKFATGTPVTTLVIKIITSNRIYHVYRGDTDSLRDGSSTITLNGSFIADMDSGDTARVTILGTGLGADTIDVEPDETFFQGCWIDR